VAVFQLRITPDDFWELTPAQFWALHDRYMEQVEHEDYRVGVIAAQIYNVNCGNRRKAREPLDYFPGHKKRAKARDEDRQQSPNEVKLRQRLASANFKKLSKTKRDKGG
jgi:hypothetical protein